jgi:hypothetical protein
MGVEIELSGTGSSFDFGPAYDIFVRQSLVCIFTA